MIKLSSIKLNSHNPRYIKDDKFKKLVASIKRDPEFMETHQIGIKNGIIMAGNMRYRALQELGYTEIPDEWVKDISKWPDDKVRRYVVVDNLGYGEWDWDLLSEQYEKEELEEWGMDIDKWKDDEVVEDEVPEVSDKPPVSKLGEVYQLGRHRLMCGDSTKIEDVEKLMDGKKADMVFTDPPYGVDYDGGVIHGSKININHKRDKLENDKIDIYKDFVPLLKSFVNGAVYIFYATRYSYEIFNALKDNEIEVMAVIAWIKTNTGYADMNSHYKNRYEPLVYCKIGDTTNFIGDNSENTTWEIDKDRVNTEHPTQKPIAVCVRAINNHKAELVLDLFLGSGSTLIACEQTNRICYGCEIDCKYIDVIIKRWMKFTGERAYKIIDADGKPCNEPVQFADESFMQLKK